jgi:FKBP-type peptidyl-prolyl cis-trans isomerase
MKVTNNSVKIINIGELSVLPGATETVPKDFVGNPVLKFLEKRGDIALFDEEAAAKEAEEAKARAEAEAKLKAEAEAKAKAEEEAKAKAADAAKAKAAEGNTTQKKA